MGTNFGFMATDAEDRRRFEERTERRTIDGVEHVFWACATPYLQVGRHGISPNYAAWMIYVGPVGPRDKITTTCGYSNCLKLEHMAKAGYGEVGRWRNGGRRGGANASADFAIRDLEARRATDDGELRGQPRNTGELG